MAAPPGAVIAVGRRRRRPRRADSAAGREGPGRRPPGRLRVPELQLPGAGHRARPAAFRPRAEPRAATRFRILRGCRFTNRARPEVCQGFAFVTTSRDMRIPCDRASDVCWVWTDATDAGHRGTTGSAHAGLECTWPERRSRATEGCDLVRDGTRRLRAGLWLAVAVGVVSSPVAEGRHSRCCRGVRQRAHAAGQQASGGDRRRNARRRLAPVPQPAAPRR